MAIHKMAWVHPDAEIGEDVEIGAFTVIERHVQIGNGTKVGNNVTVMGHTTIGERNCIYPGAVIGGEPQSKRYRGENSYVLIGNDNVIRECVTIHRATADGGYWTRIGDRNLLMACSHVAHDCELEDDIILTNNVLLAGHVRVERHATLNGAAAVNQFVTIGQHAYIGGMTRVVQDVPPYMIVEGYRAAIRGVNIVGLSRSGVPPARIEALKDAHRIIFRSDLNRDEALAKLESRNDLADEVRTLIAFLRRSGEGRNGRYREGPRPNCYAETSLRRSTTL